MPWRTVSVGWDHARATPTPPLHPDKTHEGRFSLTLVAACFYCWHGQAQPLQRSPSRLDPRRKGRPMRQALRVAPHIFRQYDIRGVVGQDLDVGVAEQV